MPVRGAAVVVEGAGGVGEGLDVVLDEAEVRAGLQEMAAVDPGKDFGGLGATLVWRGPLADGGGRAEDEAFGADGDLRRKIAGADGGFLRKRGLGLLEVQIAAVLQAELVAQVIVEGVDPAADDGVDVDLRVAEAGETAIDDSGGSTAAD